MKELHIYDDFLTTFLDKKLTDEHKAIVYEIRAKISPVLGFIPRAIPNYTNHGVQHSTNVAKLFSNFSQNLYTFKHELSEPETYLISLCIWLHDVGCLIANEDGEDTHHLKSIEVLESNAFSRLRKRIDVDDFNCIKAMILFHSSSEKDLNDVPVCEMANVRLKLICAIFRLLDDCDISGGRNSDILYNLLTEKNLLDKQSIPHWRAHISIGAVGFYQDKFVVECANVCDGERSIKNLADELAKINKVFKEAGFPTFTLSVIPPEY
ncbi:MAG: hypothetical protein LBQ98_10760 [Nitrososphaerota archaeon]|nr:hypothetical protein [Nitrososphaerota archaeon]